MITKCCGESALSLAEGFKVLHFSLGTYEQGHSLVHLFRAHIQHALRAGGALAASLSTAQQSAPVSTLIQESASSELDGGGPTCSTMKDMGAHSYSSLSLPLGLLVSPG